MVYFGGSAVVDGRGLSEVVWMFNLRVMHFWLASVPRFVDALQNIVLT